MAKTDEKETKVKYKVTISKSRRSKQHLVVNLTRRVRQNTAAQTNKVVVVDDDITTGNPEEGVSNFKKNKSINVKVAEFPSKKLLNENDVVIISAPFKTSVLLRQPNKSVTIMIATELNGKQEVQGMIPWSVDQKFTMVCTLGQITEKDAKDIIKPLVLEVMVNAYGGDKQ